MKYLLYCIVSLIVLYFAFLGCNNEQSNKINETTFGIASEDVIAETLSVQGHKEPEGVYGGLKLKAVTPGVTYIYSFYNDHTLEVEITNANETLIFGGRWSEKCDSYRDIPYQWYELRYNVETTPALAIIDKNRRLYGPINGDARIQIARMISIADNSSDPLYSQITKYVYDLTEVQ